jgi:hypothetical protein
MEFPAVEWVYYVTHNAYMYSARVTGRPYTCLVVKNT